MGGEISLEGTDIIEDGIIADTASEQGTAVPS
jgi:hypothetical protein